MKDIKITPEEALSQYSSDAYFTLNKKLLSTFGPTAAVFLTNLIDKFRYFQKEQSDKVKDGWFYQSHELQRKATGITEYGIKKSKALMKKLGILSIQKRHTPAREYYKINIDVLIGITGQDHTKTPCLDPPNPNGQEHPKSRGHINKNNKEKEHLFNKREKEKNFFPKNLNTSIKEISRKILNTENSRIFSAADPLVNEQEFLAVSYKFLHSMQTHNGAQYTGSQLSEGIICISELLIDNKIDITQLSKVADWYAIKEHAEDRFTTKIKVPSDLTIKNFLGLKGSIASFERNKNKKKKEKKPENLLGPVPTGKSMDKT